MARTKKVSTEMDDLIEALAEFRISEATIRAEFARRAEVEISKRRDKVLDLMFVAHAESGPSEIANTTGLSRSTVIRWRKDFQERDDAEVTHPVFDLLSEPVVEGAIESGEYPEWAFSLGRSLETNVDMHVISHYGEEVYVIWGDTFGYGDNADDLVIIERPDWLDDDTLKRAEEATGLKVPGATWRTK